MSDIISAPITILNEVISSPVVTASDVVNSSTQELANSTISTPVAVTEDVVNSPIQEAMNAYQLAVAAGYVGTLQEFLNGRISADATLLDNPTFAPSQRHRIRRLRVCAGNHPGISGRVPRRFPALK